MKRTLPLILAASITLSGCDTVSDLTKTYYKTSVDIWGNSDNFISKLEETDNYSVDPMNETVVITGNSSQSITPVKYNENVVLNVPTERGEFCLLGICLKSESIPEPVRNYLKAKQFFEGKNIQ